MGAKLSKFFSREQQTEAAAVGSTNGKSNEGSSIMELIKPECLKTKEMKKRKSQQLKLKPIEKKITKGRKLTLEDWLVASPSPNTFKPERFSGELHVFKQFSKRVHPSSTDRVIDNATTSRPTEGLSFSMDENPSMSRSQSGKSKKKVSFRLPEEADIIIFYSPEEALGTEYESTS